jgi:hypothetical protein
MVPSHGIPVHHIVYPSTHNKKRETKTGDNIEIKNTGKSNESGHQKDAVAEEKRDRITFKCHQLRIK